MGSLVGMDGFSLCVIAGKVGCVSGALLFYFSLVVAGCAHCSFAAPSVYCTDVGINPGAQL